MYVIVFLYFLKKKNSVEIIQWDVKSAYRTHFLFFFICGVLKKLWAKTNTVVNFFLYILKTTWISCISFICGRTLKCKTLSLPLSFIVYNFFMYRTESEYIKIRVWCDVSLKSSAVFLFLFGVGNYFPGDILQLCCHVIAFKWKINFNFFMCPIVCYKVCYSF